MCTYLKVCLKFLSLKFIQTIFLRSQFIHHREHYISLQTTNMLMLFKRKHNDTREH
jgi:hypothetical protein